MPAIGYVSRNESGGFKGQLKTFTIRAEIDIVPNDAKSRDSQPDTPVPSGTGVFLPLSEGARI